MAFLTVHGMLHLLGYDHMEEEERLEMEREQRFVMEKLGMRLADEYGGRRNKLSPEERRECLYVLEM